MIPHALVCLEGREVQDALQFELGEPVLISKWQDASGTEIDFVNSMVTNSPSGALLTGVLQSNIGPTFKVFPLEFLLQTDTLAYGDEFIENDYSPTIFQGWQQEHVPSQTEGRELFLNLLAPLVLSDGTDFTLEKLQRLYYDLVEHRRLQVSPDRNAKKEGHVSFLMRHLQSVLTQKFYPSTGTVEPGSERTCGDQDAITSILFKNEEEIMTFLFLERKKVTNKETGKVEEVIVPMVNDDQQSLKEWLIWLRQKIESSTGDQYIEEAKTEFSDVPMLDLVIDRRLFSTEATGDEKSEAELGKIYLDIIFKLWGHSFVRNVFYGTVEYNALTSESGKETSFITFIKQIDSLDTLSKRLGMFQIVAPTSINTYLSPGRIYPHLFSLLFLNSRIELPVSSEVVKVSTFEFGYSPIPFGNPFSAIHRDRAIQSGFLNTYQENRDLNKWYRDQGSDKNRNDMYMDSMKEGLSKMQKILEWDILKSKKFDFLGEKGKSELYKRALTNLIRDYTQFGEYRRTNQFVEEKNPLNIRAQKEKFIEINEVTAEITFHQTFIIKEIERDFEGETKATHAYVPYKLGLTKFGDSPNNIIRALEGTDYIFYGSYPALLPQSSVDYQWWNDPTIERKAMEIREKMRNIGVLKFRLHGLMNVEGCGFKQIFLTDSKTGSDSGLPFLKEDKERVGYTSAGAWGPVSIDLDFESNAAQSMNYLKYLVALCHSPEKYEARRYVFDENGELKKQVNILENLAFRVAPYGSHWTKGKSYFFFGANFLTSSLEEMPFIPLAEFYDGVVNKDGKLVTELLFGSISMNIRKKAPINSGGMHFVDVDLELIEDAEGNPLVLIGDEDKLAWSSQVYLPYPGPSFYSYHDPKQVFDFDKISMYFKK